MSKKTQNAPETAKAPSKGQLRVLALLARSKGPLNRHAIADKAKVNPNEVVELLGSAASTCDFVRGDGPKKLVPAGYAKAKELDVDGKSERVYEITPAGRKVLERAEKAGTNGEKGKNKGTAA